MMSQAYTLSPERQAREAEVEKPTRSFVSVLWSGIQRAYEALRPRDGMRAQFRSFYRSLLFLAEAATAAQGYLILPSDTSSRSDGQSGKQKDDWFNGLDL